MSRSAWIVSSLVVAGTALGYGTPQKVTQNPPMFLGGGLNQPQIAGVVGNTIYFTGTDQLNGEELWVSDGTPAGTHLLRDIWPGSGPGIITFNTPVVPFNGQVFFFADDGAHGLELWKTDGTTVGTVMVKDIAPGLTSSIAYNYGQRPPLVATTAGVFFPVRTDTDGTELWFSDGSAAGTVELGDFSPGSESTELSELTPISGTLFYLCKSAAASFADLCKSDGTPAGTGVLKSFSTGGARGAHDLYNWNGTLFFGASVLSSGDELWKSDGTAAGTVQVADLRLSGDSKPQHFAAFGNALYFSASGGSSGQELWKTDGTAAGTSLVADCNPGSGDGLPNWLTAAGSSLYFTAAFGSGTGPALWSSDGTDPGTRLLLAAFNSSNGGTLDGLTTFGSKVLFRARTTNGVDLFPWVADGTDAGTTQLSTQPIVSVDPAFVPFGARAFFLCQNAFSSATQICSTDGTAANTSSFAINAPGYSQSTPMATASLGSRAVFYSNGQIWTTDGTPAGTHGLGIYGTALNLIVTDNGHAYIGARTTSYGIYDTDGTDAGTVRISTPPPAGYGNILGRVGNGQVLFGYGSSAGAFGLWTTDSDGGAHKVVDLKQDGGGEPRQAATMNGLVFFVAQDSDVAGGAGVWVSDGTAAGTRPIVRYPATRPYEWWPTVHQGALYFLGPDNELWRTDGTDAGTHQAAAIGIGGFAAGFPQWLTSVGNQLFFTARGVSGDELYVTDGTQVGTSLVKDLNPGLEDSWPTQLTEWSGRVAFLADDGTGYSLFVSDGTAAGTTKVSNSVLPAVPGYSPVYRYDKLLGVPGGPLLFTAGDEGGNELWATYGNAATTRRVADLNVGPHGSLPKWFAQLPDTVVFSADDGDGGQLWALAVEHDAGVFPGTGGGAGGGAGGGEAGGPGGGGGGVSGAGGGESGSGGGGGGAAPKQGCGCNEFPSAMFGGAALLALGLIRRRRARQD